jgi:hypothetical protein
MQEPIPSELQELAARVKALSPSLQVIGFLSPGWQKGSTTPIYISGYSLKVRDQHTSETYIITTETLFAAGISTVDQTQARFLGSVRGRYFGMLIVLLGAIVLTLGSLLNGLAWIPALVLVGVGVWVWIRGRRAVPEGWPTPRDSVMMVLTGRFKRRA